MSKFTKSLVRAAKREWEFFGRSQYYLDGRKTIGKKEYEAGYSERIADYWQLIGGPYKNLTGKDRGTPWSAAFISFCMHEADAGGRFAYSAGHAGYINDSIRAAAKNKTDALYWGQDLKDHAPQVGDLVGYWRGDKKITVENARRIGWYISHTDIVVAVGDRYIEVIGGNVSHSVTLKQLKTNKKGFLTDRTKNWFVVMQNRS